MIPRLLPIFFLFGASIASAQSDHGVAVTGVGSVSVKPSIAELTFGVSANAEIAGDAITRFEQTRERVMDAMKKLAIPDATLVQQAFTIGLGSGNAVQHWLVRRQRISASRCIGYTKKRSSERFFYVCPNQQAR